MLRISTFAARQVVAALSVMIASGAAASPGPPPPQYIVEMASQVAPTQTAATFDRYADGFANDLTVWVDGKEIVSSKAGWLALERHRLGKVDRRVLGYATGYESILVIDQFDDRSDLPDNPNILFDARYKTRASQYQLGADHLIHVIRITQTEGILRPAS